MNPFVSGVAKIFAAGVIGFAIAGLLALTWAPFVQSSFIAHNDFVQVVALTFAFAGACVGAFGTVIAGFLHNATMSRNSLHILIGAGIGVVFGMFVIPGPAMVFFGLYGALIGAGSYQAERLVAKFAR